MLQIDILVTQIYLRDASDLSPTQTTTFSSTRKVARRAFEASSEHIVLWKLELRKFMGRQLELETALRQVMQVVDQYKHA